MKFEINFYFIGTLIVLRITRGRHSIDKKKLLFERILRYGKVLPKHFTLFFLIPSLLKFKEDKIFIRIFYEKAINRYKVTGALLTSGVHCSLFCLNRSLKVDRHLEVINSLVEQNVQWKFFNFYTRINKNFKNYFRCNWCVTLTSWKHKNTLTLNKLHRTMLSYACFQFCSGIELLTLQAEQNCRK